MDNKIIIGARGSKLSLAYASKVRELILNKSKATEKMIEIKIIKTSGDLFKSENISDLGGKNLFCKEIENELTAKKIDIAIHALKDMGAEESDKLVVQAFIERNDPRDALVSFKFKNLSEINSGRVGSSSKRRELQLGLINKKNKIKSIRGNVDTRIQKVKEGHYEGVILALAGLKMLKMEKLVKEVFSLNDFIPAIGQGIIAAQCRKNDERIKKILMQINHDKTKICAIAERSFLKTIGGDCHTAVGGLATIKNDLLKLRVQLFSDDCKKVFNIEKEGSLNEPKKLGIDVGMEILKKAGVNFKKKI